MIIMKNKIFIYYMAIFWLIISLSPILSIQAFPQSSSELKEERIFLEPPGKPEASIELWLDKYKFQPGEELKINFSVDKRCYVYIYNIDVKGKVNLLFPNRFHRDNYLEAGTYQIPRRNYRLPIGEDTGIEYLQAIISSDPIRTLTENKDFSRYPFLPLGSNPASLAGDVRSQLTDSDVYWNSDWLSYKVYIEKGLVKVTSEPPNGRVYAEGNYQGRTPLMIELSVGKNEIYIEKPGFPRWRKSVEVMSDQINYLHVDLRQVSYEEEKPDDRSETGPTYEVPLSSFGVTASLDSISGEIVFADTIGLGMGIRWPDPWPEEIIDGFPYSLEGGEYEIYGIYQQRVVPDLLDLWINGGVAVQFLEAQPFNSYFSNELSTMVEPVADYEARFFPMGGAGLSFQRRIISLRAGWGVRRGFLFGFHFHF